MEENSIQNFGTERCATVTGRNPYKISCLSDLFGFSSGNPSIYNYIQYWIKSDRGQSSNSQSGIKHIYRYLTLKQCMSFYI